MRGPMCYKIYAKDICKVNIQLNGGLLSNKLLIRLQTVVGLNSWEKGKDINIKLHTRTHWRGFKIHLSKNSKEPMNGWDTQKEERKIKLGNKTMWKVKRKHIWINFDFIFFVSHLFFFCCYFIAFKYHRNVVMLDTLMYWRAVT